MVNLEKIAPKGDFFKNRVKKQIKALEESEYYFLSTCEQPSVIFTNS